MSWLRPWLDDAADDEFERDEAEERFPDDEAADRADEWDEAVHELGT